MQLGIINSAFAQVGVDFATGIRHIREIGFDTVDIQTEAWGISAAEKEMIVRECRANSLPIISVLLRPGHRRFQRSGAAFPSGQGESAPRSGP